ncbi:hypothetical protein VTJ83DRAFT_6096 [Remersonia thermophila]|uniref:Uncharacterized protein n=1 Tax=Remersonia thermophila TaxID=72144 RepID=A0ABR4DAU9_9PEZI
MLEAVNELKQKLGLNHDDKAFQTSQVPSSVPRVVVRFVFMFRKSQFDDILRRLRDGVSSLESLVNLNVELEEGRQSRSAFKAHRSVQTIAKDLSRSLTDSIACQCPDLHNVGLGLVKTQDIDHLYQASNRSEMLCRPMIWTIPAAISFPTMVPVDDVSPPRDATGVEEDLLPHGQQGRNDEGLELWTIPSYPW